MPQLKQVEEGEAIERRVVHLPAWPLVIRVVEVSEQMGSVSWDSYAVDGDRLTASASQPGHVPAFVVDLVVVSADQEHPRSQILLAFDKGPPPAPRSRGRSRSRNPTNPRPDSRRRSGEADPGRGVGR